MECSAASIACFSEQTSPLHLAVGEGETAAELGCRIPMTWNLVAAPGCGDMKNRAVR
jgi:hypothetical protein